jgi:hypothetical protein
LDSKISHSTASIPWKQSIIYNIKQQKKGSEMNICIAYRQKVTVHELINGLKQLPANLEIALDTGEKVIGLFADDYTARFMTSGKADSEHKRLLADLAIDHLNLVDCEECGKPRVKDSECYNCGNKT